MGYLYEGHASLVKRTGNIHHLLNCDLMLLWVHAVAQAHIV
jgi:hypothetical protein